METAGCMGKHYAWALGRGMREGAWWTAEQGQPCCGCKASDVHQAWGMRVWQAALGLAQGVRGMRARGHALCTSMAWHGIRDLRSRSTQGTAGASPREQGVGTGQGGRRTSVVDKQSKEDSDAVDAKPAMYTGHGARGECYSVDKQG